MKTFSKIGVLALLTIPSITFAQTYFSGISELIDRSRFLVRNSILLMAGIAVLVFFVGLVKFISKAGDADAVKEGRTLMIWGTVALFVMASIWGLVSFLGNQFDIHQDPAPGIENVIPHG